MRRVCIASVLNPVEHPRLYRKEALSLSRSFKVYVVGQSPRAKPYCREGVILVPLNPFRRLSAVRLFASWLVLKKCLIIGADLYILHTPELLWAGLWLKYVKGAQVIYDVHEDYKLNLKHSAAYPYWMRAFVPRLVRAWERFCARRLDGAIYAEAVYDNMLKLSAECKIVLPNLFRYADKALFQNSATPAQREIPVMLFAGTIAADWGVFETIRLWAALQTYLPVRLRIVGHAPQPDVLRAARALSQKLGAPEALLEIRTGANSAPLPYPEILLAVGQCDFGTALYRPRPNIRGRIPSKFAEFIAAEKPLLFTDLPEWRQLNERTPFGLPVAPQAPDVENIARAIAEGFGALRPQAETTETWQWENCEPALLEFIDSRFR